MQLRIMLSNRFKNLNLHQNIFSKFFKSIRLLIFKNFSLKKVSKVRISNNSFNFFIDDD